MINKLENILSKKIIVFSIIAGLALIIYSNSFSSPFTLDDFGSISNNYDIRNPFNVIAIWKFYSNRFIIYFTFSINFFIFAMCVPMHRLNLLASPTPPGIAIQSTSSKKLSSSSCLVKILNL